MPENTLKGKGICSNCQKEIEVLAVLNSVETRDLIKKLFNLQERWNQIATEQCDCQEE